MSVTSATTIAAQILSNTLAVLKTVREQAKESKDATLKSHISDLYDSVLSLKEAVMLVTDENRELRRRIEELEKAPETPVPMIRQVGLVNYYFVGEEGPYCQPCYDAKSKLVRVTPPEPWSGGQRRHCPVCHAIFQETKGADGPVRLGGRRGGAWS
jgi:hypothetical protein